MAKDIQEFRIKLLNKIGNADSGTDVIRLIDTAIKTLTESKTHGHVIIRFIEKAYTDIDRLQKDCVDQEERQKILHTALTRLIFLKTQLTGSTIIK